MRNFLTLFVLLLSMPVFAQTICGTAGEGGVVTLTAPAGNVFTSIEFASYGTPNGSCGSFTLGGCHATNSSTICATALVGHNSASINATNAVFGDPCSGTVKRLYIQARYSSTLPVRLVSFTVKKNGQGSAQLNWTADEINTSIFSIEKSTDGQSYQPAGSINAVGNGRNSYQFTDTTSRFSATLFYRLKTADQDGHFQYSNVVSFKTQANAVLLSLFPNPAGNLLTLTSSKRQMAFISNVNGQLVQELMLINGSQTLNIENWKAGIYFIRTNETTLKFIKN